MVFGMNGAALADFGEIAAAFFPGAPAVELAPFGDRNDGVKLGESTFRSCFFCWLTTSVSMDIVLKGIPGISDLSLTAPLTSCDFTSGPL